MLTTILSFLGCAKTPISTASRPAILSDFRGTYVGFSPTDESAVSLGEMELIISNNELSIRMATGLKIEKESLRSADFVAMTQQEVATEYNPGAVITSRMIGFRGRGGSPELLFLKDAKGEDGPGLILHTGGLAELLGPTVLFTPSQVRAGDFDKAIAMIEKEAGKGTLPRLRNDGKAEK